MENIDINRLDGRTLRMFLAIYETGSVSATAELFDLNQSTVSHALEKLRAAIGDPLFTKSGRGITPTEKALSIIPRVREVLAGIEGLVESETYDVSKDLKPLSIAIPTPALVEEMKAVTREVRARAPTMELRITRLAPRERITQVLDTGEADVAIGVSGITYSAMLNHCHYCSDQLRVFYDSEMRDAPSSMAAYAKADHGVAGFGGRTKSVVEIALGEHGIERKVALVAPTASMLGELIRGTDMMATMPSKLAGGVYRHLSSCAPPVALPNLQYELVWHRRNEHSGRNTWLRQLILDSANA